MKLSKHLKNIFENDKNYTNYRWYNFFIMNEWDKKLKDIYNEFLKKLNKNAQLTSSGKDLPIKYKYPYKPALLISLISEIEDVNKLFNNDILIDDKIAKRYYDILTNSEEFYEVMKLLSSKKNWLQLGFNKNIKNQVIFNIFDQPAYYLTINNCNFWIADKNRKTIRMNLPYYSKEILESFRDKLLIEAFKTLKNCIPDYSSFTNEEILNWGESMLMIWATENSNPSDVNYEQKTRRYQHIFRKLVLDRDQKCLICCASNPSILEACHLKPYSKCNNDIDRYSCENGITLCKNHHKLFDMGLITFLDDWTIQVSNSLKLDNDFDILIKTFEPCYKMIPQQKSPADEYLKYHRHNIFIDYER